MSKFEVKVVKIDGVVDHPNADRLSLVKIGGYSIVSAKLEDGSHRYKAGDLVVYVPENSIVPEYLLKRGFWNEEKNIGFLAGPLGNRVKPIKLRGILSEGILFPTINTYMAGKNVVCIETETTHDEEIGEIGHLTPVKEGDDVTKILGIVKWEPEVPANMSGDLVGYAETVNYDIENIKKYDRLFVDGEMIYITEKLHGTQVQIGWMIGENDPNLFDGKFFVTSKGMAAKNVILKDTEENRTKNLYVRALLENKDKFEKLTEFFSLSKKVVFFGEIFGKGVQDLNYNQQKATLRIFDIYVDGEYLDLNDLVRIIDYAELEQVPILYVGPYSKEIVDRETNGTTKINGAHIREGAVIKPQIERQDQHIGRLILKSISENYLQRKNATEYT